MVYQHMRFTGAALLLTGDLLAHGGMDRRAACRAARDASGSAPVSAGASMELGQLIAAMSEDRPGVSCSSRTASRSRCWRSCARSTARWPCRLRLPRARRWRLLDGFDIGGAVQSSCWTSCCARSVPPSIRSGWNRWTSANGSPRSGSQVPAQHRGQFDELFEEARLTYRSATSAGSSATSGPRGSCAGPPWRAAGDLPRRAGSMSRSTSWTPVEEMCSLLLAGVGFGRRACGAVRVAEPHTPSDAPRCRFAAASAARPIRCRRPRDGSCGRSVSGSSRCLPALTPHEDNLLHGLGASAGVYEGPGPPGFRPG